MVQLVVDTVTYGTSYKIFIFYKKLYILLVLYATSNIIFLHHSWHGRIEPKATTQYDNISDISTGIACCFAYENFILWQKICHVLCDVLNNGYNIDFVFEMNTKLNYFIGWKFYIVLYLPLTENTTCKYYFKVPTGCK